MITGWLVKVVLGIALFGLVLHEVGSPLITKAQADDAAHTVADKAALELFSSRNGEAAQRVAEEAAIEAEVRLERFAIDAQGTIHVTVGKKARALLLDRFDATERFYDVEAEASATPRRIR